MPLGRKGPPPYERAAEMSPTASTRRSYKKDGKIKGLPDMSMKINEMKNGPWSNPPLTRDVQEK